MLNKYYYYINLIRIISVVIEMKKGKTNVITLDDQISVLKGKVSHLETCGLFLQEKYDELNKKIESIENVIKQLYMDITLKEKKKVIEYSTRTISKIHKEEITSIANVKEIKCIKLLNDKRIAAGIDNDLTLNIFDYKSKTFVQDVIKKNAHNDSIEYITEIAVKQQILSSSEDGVVKLWDYSSKLNVYLLETFKAHDNSITQLLPLTVHRFVSCSKTEFYVKLWNCRTHKQIHNVFIKQDKQPHAMLLLKQRQNTLLVSYVGFNGSGEIKAYDAVPPYAVVCTVEKTFTECVNGMVELGNGNVVVVQESQERMIKVLDGRSLKVIERIIDNERICFGGSVCAVGEDAMFVVNERYFMQVLKKNGKYEVVYCKGVNGNEVSARKGIVVVEEGKYFVMFTIEDEQECFGLFRCSYMLN